MFDPRRLRRHARNMRKVNLAQALALKARLLAAQARAARKDEVARRLKDESAQDSLLGRVKSSVKGFTRKLISRGVR
jgi:hypothetical protein